jgi:hypothetical protein
VLFHVSFLQDGRRPVPMMPLSQDHFVFSYGGSSEQRDLLQVMRPGDLLLYAGAGPVSVLSKLTRASQWSHCGLVVGVPNKWTGREELCVLEFGRNREGFLDVLAERPLHCGPSLMRLPERIHGVHGTEVWLCRRHDRKPDVAAEQRLTRWALAVHAEFVDMLVKLKPDREIPVPFQALDFGSSSTSYLELFGISPTKSKSSYCELYSPEVCARGLRQLGIEIPTSRFLGVNDIIRNSSVFDKPVLVRCRPEFQKNLHWPNQAPAASPPADKAHVGSPLLSTHLAVTTPTHHQHQPTQLVLPTPQCQASPQQ